MTLQCPPLPADSAARRFTLACTLCILSAATATTVLPGAKAHAASLEAASRISNVILYPDAALVTRVVMLDIPPGSHEIILPDLPISVDPGSLRAEANGTADVTIGGIDLRTTIGKPAADAELALRLKTRKDSRDRLSDTIEAAEGRKIMIQRLAQLDPTSLAKGLDLEVWLKAVEAVGTGLQAVNHELRTLQIDISKLDEEIAALAAAIGEPERQGPKRLAAIAIEARSAGQMQLHLSYRVRGASWRPIYDARLDTLGPRPGLQLTRRAILHQATGEDWADIRITLSTLRVQRGTAAPAISGERIAIREIQPPMPAPLPRAAASDSVAQFAGKTSRREEVASRLERIDEQQASVEASAFQADFVVPGTSSLPSGHEEKSVMIVSERFEPALRHKAAPALVATAYLEAQFILKGDVPLLAGEILLTRNNAFIGRGRLGDAAPGETIKLGFGADDRVKISRVPLLREAKDAGLFGAMRSEEFRFRNDIRNLHGFPVEVEVHDRLPISEDQQITVERLPDTTKPDIESVDDRRGVMAWHVKLAPHESRSLATAWRVRWPNGKHLVTSPLPR
ncbi:Conserved hypothetical protein CHP02231 [Rhabdaerophilaceae bacterium]